MAQSGEISSSHRVLDSVDDLISAAKKTVLIKPSYKAIPKEVKNGTLLTVKSTTQPLN